MGALTAWTYPLRGAALLLTSPDLLRQLTRFLWTVLLCSLLAVLVWWRLFFPAHTRLLAWLLGGSCAGWACRGAAALAVAAESALPVWLVFEHRFSRLKQRLFLQTLEKRGARVAAAGAPDADALARALQERRRLRALSGGPASAKPGAARAPGGSSSISSTSAGGFGITSGLSLEVAAQLVKALLVPGPGEPKRIKLARLCLATPLKLLAPVTLPLWIVCEAGAEAEEHFGRYLRLKGIADPEARALVAGARGAEYRSFGLMAALLNQLPLANYFLGLGNSVGAALWAADVERQGGRLYAKR